MPRHGIAHHLLYARRHAEFLARKALSTWLGWDVSLGGEDREVLERVILPGFAAREDIRRVLFAGCEWYTKFYPKLFGSREFCTIDLDPEMRRWGGTTHVVDALANVSRHFPASHFDLVVCNGLLGFGIKTREDAERSLESCLTCLRAGGYLLLGYCDTDEHRPRFEVDGCDALSVTQRYDFEPLGASEHRVHNRWELVYRFYQKNIE